ncbi:MAG: hypothetical protein M1823_003783 [Watsoniomyces obsoletus]|nr:MAG: hypothetical protein M1823_003783 [Watsoniomyces obsoletus]
MSVDHANHSDDSSFLSGPMDTTSTTETTKEGLGIPHHKPISGTAEVLAILCSLVSLVICICVVTPRLPLAWRLGFEGQIIVVGFLLGVMNLCLRAVTPALLVLLEARFGNSRLQNYDAILTNSMHISQTSLHWRGIILVLMAFPLALGVAYKRFIGGQTTVVLSNTTTTMGSYGAMLPPLGMYEAVQNSAFLMTFASAHFRTASRNASVPFPFADMPIAYGFNTLLLDNTSAALLDTPSAETLISTQQKLVGNEVWHLSASVRAIVARYNSSDVYKKDPTVWKKAFNGSLYALNGVDMLNNYYFGLLIEERNRYPDRCYLGAYRNEKPRDQNDPVVRHEDPDDSNVQSFRSAAVMFDVRREQCAGTWKIEKNNIALVDGSCTGVPTTRAIRSSLLGGRSFDLGTLPVLRSNLEGLTLYWPGSPWHLSSYAISVASLYWARVAWFMQDDISSCMAPEDICYPAAADEHISSTRSTLNPAPLLYLTFLLQPVLILIATLLRLLFYSIPLSSGFGLIAMLSGIEPNELERLRGAGFSGALSKPVSVAITVEEENDDEVVAEKRRGTGRIRYTLDPISVYLGRLRRGVKYG